MTDPGTFAFLVHPRAQVAADMARIWAPLGRLPEAMYDTGLRRFPVPPVVISSAEIGGRQMGHVVLVPLGARHMLDRPGEARDRIRRAVNRAVKLGADVVGLGALTGPVTAGGVALRGRTDIGVTNGNAFTAAIVDSQVRQLLDAGVTRSGARDVAVVGATGSVGTAVVGLLARDRAVDRLTVMARSAPRLNALAHQAGRRVSTTATTRIDDVANADLIVLLTASSDAVLRAEHLKPGAVVLDATQPRNTSPDLLTSRPDVTVVDGGIVDIPSLRLKGGDIGLPNGRAYACFAETALLALSGHEGHFALGVPSLEQVDHVRQLATAHAALGFVPAAPTSFGYELNQARWGVDAPVPATQQDEDEAAA
jgi:predicted amino acid dehydrogenase